MHRLSAHIPAGFTLVEVLLVVVILGIVAAGVVPSFGRSLGTMALETTAQDMLYRMRYAQSRAVTRRNQVFFVLDDKARQYWLEEGPDEEAEQDAPARRNVPGSMGRRATVAENIELKATQPQAAFGADGDISPVRIELCQENQCRLVSTEEQRGQVVISELIEEPRTGRLM